MYSAAADLEWMEVVVGGIDEVNQSCGGMKRELNGGLEMDLKKSFSVESF